MLQPLYEGLVETKIFVESDNIIIDEPEKKDTDYASEYFKCYNKITEIEDQLEKLQDEFIDII